MKIYSEAYKGIITLCQKTDFCDDSDSDDEFQ